LRQLQTGQGAYCFAVADSLARAFRGKPPFLQPHDRLRAMFSVFPLYLHIAVKREAPIQTFKDLKRGRISAGDRDFTTARVVTKLLQTAGLASTPLSAERRMTFLDYQEAHREFLDDKLEAVISLTALDDPSYRELARRAGIRLLPMDRRLINAFVSEHPTYEAAAIPGSTYPGCGAVTETIMAPTVMVTTIDRSEAEVYEVIQTIYENRKELASAVSGFKAFEPNFIFRGVTIPLHPAAERFWCEQGLIEGRKAL
jgi:TRAP transporter TAXI family solute receptor